MRIFAISILISVMPLIMGCGGGIWEDQKTVPEPLLITTMSGLKYSDFFVSPLSIIGYGDTVLMNYRGFLPDGQQFKSTYDDGSPIEFVVGDGKVIAAWDEGIVGMGVGGKRKLVVPPDLAYGATGNSELGIPPNTTLTYYIEPKERKPVTIEITESGLQWGDIAVGTGPSPGPDDTVVVKYKGWLTDGTVFDSTPEGQTSEFKLSGLIQGWKEGLSTMKVGGIRKLVIPHTLGYGPSGAPPKIPGYATLIFRIELVDVKPGT